VVFDVDGLGLTERTPGGKAAATLGRSVVEKYLAADEPPAVVHILGDGEDDLEATDGDAPEAQTPGALATSASWRPRGLTRTFGAAATSLGRAARPVGATVVGWILAAVAIPGFVDWFYPGPLIAVLVVALLGSWGWMIVWLGRASPADQLRLNRLLEVLPRAAIRSLDMEDFTIAWRAEKVYVLRAVLGLDAVEDHLISGALEARRKRLMCAVDALLSVEASNAWNHRMQDGFRDVGVSSGEADAGGWPYQQLVWRSELIHAAAREVIAAYDELVREARVEGFDVPPSDLSG
jgi:hypothetical protein